jgi:glyoxylase-like metal-dependent hydrolase (beta-lactamase superfamily II)/rhodanese-related sulfurtransferase
MEYICPVCGKKIARELEVIIGHTDQHIVDAIKRQYPKWSEADGSCRKCYDYYKSQMENRAMGKNPAIKQFSAGSCYSYILSSGKDAAVIDPHISLQSDYNSYLLRNGLKLRYIIDTHTHADHFSLAAVLKKTLGVPIVMGEKAISDIADKRVKEGEALPLGQSALKIMYTPGHTDDAITVHTEGALFTGDVLLIGGVGRTDFQNGSPESMFDTLQRLKSLPDDTVVYPGHDYSGKTHSTIKAEKAHNMFMKQEDKAAFVANMRSKVMPKPFNIDNIIRLNRKGQATALKMVSPKDAIAITAKDPAVVFLDVRSMLEYGQSHIKDAFNVPIDAVMARIDELGKSGKKYIVLCRTGNRSPMAADMLLQSGIAGVMVLDGGMIRWEKERLPVIKGIGGVSLERQVRIIAGSVVLSGILLAHFVNPAFIAISLFIGCGLIYAGITDNCMMGMLLMKLPYNRNMYKAKSGGGTCAVG